MGLPSLGAERCDDAEVSGKVAFWHCVRIDEEKGVSAWDICLSASLGEACDFFRACIESVAFFGLE